MAINERMPAPVYDPITPVTAHEGLAAAMFQEHFSGLEAGSVVLNVAAGRTNLYSDIKRYEPHHALRIISLDPTYYDGSVNNNLLSGVAEDIRLPDNSVDLTLCQFGLQHMHKPADAIREMVRVTREAVGDDPRSGTIILNPVFTDPSKAEQALSDRGLDGIARIERPPEMRGRQTDILPSLILRKTPELTDDALTELMGLTEEAKLFTPSRKSAGERVARLLTRVRRHYPVL